ncbi:AraC family transcriptional regulator [Acidisoma silvae]|uniref:AraC family transcriptional regulator n=1 Tax=Acidisoma silvae TaxID=2802396 RepID=A0A963YPF4_9PROT|nr:AraC family transcriptional regulator [Acidisoma silvae]MCB8874594.1 AraC family transcriptional regulator [Acidisoma silvae]
MTTRFYHATEADSAEALNRAIPGARFDWIADAGTSFRASFQHMLLDGIALTQLGLEQASYVTLGERVVNFNIWHAIGTKGTVNGRQGREDDLVLVRPGEGATLHTEAPILIQSFALHPGVLAQAEALQLPSALMTAPVSGRWHLAGQTLSAAFLARHRAIMAEVGGHPALMAQGSTRAALHNTLLDMIATLGDAGHFAPDRSTAGRHTRIMQRFEQIAREAVDEPLSLADLCRLTGTSRRSLAAIVLERTGRSPAAYLRWRRLWLAKEILSRPDDGMTVTEVAYRLGFWHLGRFAAAYAQAFGERPSRTLARAAG